ncbi:MAG: hypothetical protein ACSHXY_04580 [Alphaproteobacteria bacterium]
MARATRYFLLLLALLGVIAGGRLSIEHLRFGKICPMLGPIPACLIVFLGYSAIGIGAFLGRTPKSRNLFFLGWLPITGLALSGVAAELLGEHICPLGAFDVPQCFYSLLMAMICLALFLMHRRLGI